VGISRKAYKVYAKYANGRVSVELRTSDERKALAKLRALKRDKKIVEAWHEYG